MRIRYHNGPDGKPVKKALVYTSAEHGINPRAVDQDALRIVERLWQNGHKAYIVGGAVRDLILGRRPKDYDIVSDAEPQRIKRLFYRSRIIGRRFRLVHVYVGTHIYEVCTFRSIANGTIGNTYGTIDEDACRRDFSLNALYYDPLSGELLDYVQGLRDIKAKKIVPVIPLQTIFVEDPVRMLRALKYSQITGFQIPLFTRLAIKKHAHLLSGASVSRLAEEAMKIFGSGKAMPILAMLLQYKLLDPIVPSIAKILQEGGPRALTLRSDLCALDAYVHETGDKALASLLTFVLRLPVRESVNPETSDPAEAFRQALFAARDFLFPITLPRIEVEKAVRACFIVPEPRPKLRKPRKRSKRKPNSHAASVERDGDQNDSSESV